MEHQNWAEHPELTLENIEEKLEETMAISNNAKHFLRLILRVIWPGVPIAIKMINLSEYCNLAKEALKTEEKLPFDILFRDIKNQSDEFYAQLTKDVYYFLNAYFWIHTPKTIKKIQKHASNINKIL